MTNILLLLLGLAIILASAELFTNGVEWLGKKLQLNEGSVGSILAAVGTALPESIIPVIAVLTGTGQNAIDIGTGAILGAPFVLSTLALAIAGVAGLLCKRNGCRRQIMHCNRVVMTRDLQFFLGAFGLVILTSFLPPSVKLFIPAVLLILYVTYVIKTLKCSSDSEDDGEINPLFFSRNNSAPSLFMVLLQVAVGLAGIVYGAHLFVDVIEELAGLLGISAFILAFVISPIATELPEKVNSLIWIRQGKDTLALGNITGAMVFQSTVIPAIGIALTPWKLTSLALSSALVSVAAAGFVLYCLKTTGQIKPSTLAYNGVLYGIFLAALAFNF
ncbi:sodium:calcium antiporter [Desulforamulus putei]|uniref:sodium:calcium antiporter n=1 Tax=Desulforamulus putei TaxID=74701 RepID=UPI002FDF039D